MAHVSFRLTVGHLLQQPHESCYRRIVELFGNDGLNADGTISRPKLGAIVYADPQKMARLNAITIHLSGAGSSRRSRQNKNGGCVPFVTVEAALLLEDHYDEICDEIWYVHTDDAVPDQIGCRKAAAIRRNVPQDHGKSEK